MTTDAKTSTRHEAEVDEQLAELWSTVSSAQRDINSIRNTLARTLGLKRHGSYGSFYYTETIDEIVALAEAKLDGLIGYVKTEVVQALDKIVAARAAAEPLEAEYNAQPWSRFFLVTSSDGHIHSSMQCSTCYHDTEFGWLPTLSGLTQADAVAEHGEILCSICFPDAPVAWTNGTSKKTQAERAARDAAKRERDAAKNAKAIYDLDGSVLKDDSGYEIKTEVTARRELSSALQYEYMEYGAKYTAYAERLAAAIANKTGENAEELLSAGRVKAKKTVDRERRKYAAQGG
jgi:hypothetical protein